MVKQALITLLLLSGCSKPKVEQEHKTIEQTIPITMANMRGHESLYNEGWFVIASSKEAIAYAKEHAIISAKDAFDTAVVEIANSGNSYAKELVKHQIEAAKSAQNLIKIGNKNSQQIFATTQEVVDKQVAYASDVSSRAWETFIKGNISLAKRSEDDLTALSLIPGEYFDSLKSDFSNIQDLSDSMIHEGREGISRVWEPAFEEAKTSFVASYEDSGEAQNSIDALFYIMGGYFKALYQGVLSPSVDSGAESVS
jgi:hypothetical protein